MNRQVSGGSYPEQDPTDPPGADDLAAAGDPGAWGYDEDPDSAAIPSDSSEGIYPQEPFEAEPSSSTEPGRRTVQRPARPNQSSRVGGLGAPGQGGVRLPPHSIEAEQSVLGALLINNRAWEEVSDLIGEGDFYRHDHSIIWRHMAELARFDRPMDVVTVHDALRQSGGLESAGGIPYLHALSQYVATAANVRYYATMVRERAMLRRLINVTEQINVDAFDPQGRTVDELLDMAESRIFQVSEDSNRQGTSFRDMGELLTTVFNRIDELVSRENPSEVTGVPTGFVDLDRMTSGMQPGDLIIVAARPSVGKTAFALNIGEHVAVREHLPVAVFSMEMGAEQLTMRLLGSVGRIDQQNLRNGRLTDDDFMRLTDALEKLNGAPLFIDETPALNPLELRARARRLTRQYGQLGLIIVDYLQLMSVAGGNSNDVRATQVAEISRSLKALAKELKCPLIALSQLSRKVEERPDKRPIMSDLRESGAIEQDADVIFFIHREDRYDPDSENKGMAEIIIGKQRNGPIGSVTLSFLGPYTRFDNFIAQSPYS